MTFQGPALPTMALPPADGMSSAQLGRAAMAMARQTGEARTVPYLGVQLGWEKYENMGNLWKNMGNLWKNMGHLWKNMGNLWKNMGNLWKKYGEFMVMFMDFHGTSWFFSQDCGISASTMR